MLSRASELPLRWWCMFGSGHFLSHGLTRNARSPLEWACALRARAWVLWLQPAVFVLVSADGAHDLRDRIFVPEGLAALGLLTGMRGATPRLCIQAKLRTTLLHLLLPPRFSRACSVARHIATQTPHRSCAAPKCTCPAWGHAYESSEPAAAGERG